MLKQVNGESTTIIKEQGYYHGWPTIARADDGELIVVFSGRRSEHVCPYGQTILVRSHDDGVTWSRPEVVNNTPLDDRDAGIIVLGDGTWLVSWFTSVAFKAWETRMRGSYGDDEVDRWKPYMDATTPEVQDEWLDSWTRRSTDRGKTWEPRVNAVATSPHGPTELSDGRLLYVGGWETYKKTGEPVVDVMESSDQGRTWSYLAQIPVALGTQRGWYHEPHCVETATGRIVCLFRFQIPSAPRVFRVNSPFQHDYMTQTESDDGGCTWTTMHQSPILCHPPHLIRLHNDWILVTYGGRYKPYGQRACISRDGGQTWNVDREILIRDDAPNSDLGYPASVQLKDGSIYTVYYQVDNPGEKPCIIGTRWEIPNS